MDGDDACYYVSNKLGQKLFEMVKQNSNSVQNKTVFLISEAGMAFRVIRYFYHTNGRNRVEMVETQVKMTKIKLNTWFIHFIVNNYIMYIAY